MPKTGQNTWLGDLLLLSLIFSGLFFILLGTRPLFVPDEGRYAEIAREMLERGDYITPYLNGIKYFEKPVLFYWLEVMAIKLGGLNLWSVRSVNALLALITCLLTYTTVRIIYDRATAFLAALILSTSVLYFVMAHMVNLDLPVTAFVTASLYFFLLGSREPPGLKRMAYFWGKAGAAGLAVLTKGLIGIAFPILIIGSWLAFTNQWRLLKNTYVLSTLFIFLLIVTPWHWMVAVRNPDFLHFYFVEQQFLRFLTTDIGHNEPVWFFLPSLIMGFFPWIVFLPLALRFHFKLIWQDRKQYQTELYFILWASLIFIFFSLSKSKLIPYILPIFPPLAILTARYLRLSFLDKSTWRGIRIGFISLVLCAFALALVYFLLPTHIPMPDPRLAAIHLNLAALVIILGALFSCFLSFRSLQKGFVALFATMYCFLLITLAALPAIDARTVQAFAQHLKVMLKPEDEVIAFNQYYQDLPFYLERRISILNWRNELSHGMKYQDTKAWMLDDEGFWQRFRSSKRVFVILDAKRYEELIARNPNDRFYLLNRTPNNVLISNHGV